MKAIKTFFKNFFSVSNEINENIVIGSMLTTALLVGTFLPLVSDDKYYILASMVCLFFGIGAFKK